jgi:hypothetical protein
MKKRNYSYNCGRPIEKMIVPTDVEVMDLFAKLRRTKQVFRVDFIKRTTGELRTMLCQFGVKKHLKGGKAAYNPSKKNLFFIYSSDKQGYRSFGLNDALLLKHGGIVYNLNKETNIRQGVYKVHLPPGRRTFEAHTSPIYQVDIVEA